MLAIIGKKCLLNSGAHNIKLNEADVLKVRGFCHPLIGHNAGRERVQLGGGISEGSVFLRRTLVEVTRVLFQKLKRESGWQAVVTERTLQAVSVAALHQEGAINYLLPIWGEMWGKNQSQENAHIKLHTLKGPYVCSKPSLHEIKPTFYPASSGEQGQGAIQVAAAFCSS